MIIERKDANCGWGNGFRLKIINEMTNKELYLNIESSSYNFKKIYIEENFFQENILIKNFFIDNTIDNFLLHVTEDENNKKLIIFNNHRNPWDNLNLKLNLNNIIHNIIIPSSNVPLKIINI